jgi:putative mRNA 3-end processing factor
VERLLTFDGKGIYCPKADIHIDPWKKVPRALITHGHSDHARWGMGAYLCTHESVPILNHRLGSNNKIQGINFGESLSINGVKFSFHPAGHVIGSAQIRVEYKDEIWLVSGDYKLANDGISKAYEPVKCHTFITESTFGLPVYKWENQDDIFHKMNQWWRKNKADGRVSVITAYSLGKAQRLINGLDPSIGKVYTHGAIENTNKILREHNHNIQETIYATAQYKFDDYKGNMVVCPPSAVNSAWVKKFKDFRVGIASGWMQMRGARRRRAADIGFVLSDHADWNDLNTAIKATEAQEIYVTHGFSRIYSQYLKEKGYDAKVVETAFEGERLDTTEEEKVAS